VKQVPIKSIVEAIAERLLYAGVKECLVATGIIKTR